MAAGPNPPKKRTTTPKTSGKTTSRRKPSSRRRKRSPGLPEAARAAAIAGVSLAACVVMAVAILALRSGRPDTAAAAAPVASAPAGDSTDAGTPAGPDAGTPAGPDAGTPAGTALAEGSDDHTPTGAASPDALPAPASRSGERSAPQERDRSIPSPAAPPEGRTPVGTGSSPVASRSGGTVERPPKPAPRRKGTLVMVLDDAGNNLRDLRPFLALPMPLTVAVLPGLPHSAEAARMVREAGKELLLHQPMEAIGGENPGPGAIDVSMDDAEIREILERNVAELGPIDGMNNHQGSKVTSDERVMETVLAFCRDAGIYYLDSRTTADTVVPAVASRTGIRIRERDVFVDNIQERAAMIRSIHEGMQKAEKQGAAVMIGHVWSADLASVLQELYPELVEEGYSLSTISRIMMGNWDDEDTGD